MAIVKKLAAAAVLAYCAVVHARPEFFDVQANDGHDITCSALKPANGDAGGVWGTSPKISEFYPFVTPPQGESCRCSIGGLPCEGIGRFEYGDNNRHYLYYYSCVRTPDTGKYTCCEDALRLVTPWGAVDCAVNPDTKAAPKNKPKPSGGLLLQKSALKTSILGMGNGK